MSRAQARANREAGARVARHPGTAPATVNGASRITQADLLVITKCELVDAARLEHLREALAREIPRAEILAVSVKTGTGVQL